MRQDATKKPSHQAPTHRRSFGVKSMLPGEKETFKTLDFLWQHRWFTVDDTCVFMEQMKPSTRDFFRGLRPVGVVFYDISQFFGSALCLRTDSQQERKSTGINLFRKLCTDCLTPLFSVGSLLSAFQNHHHNWVDLFLCSFQLQFKHQMCRKQNGGNSFWIWQ